MTDKNTLWFGDNLDVLRKFPDKCVDLIYLDPPFNSNASYNMLFKEKSGIHSEAQHKAFEDTWSWEGNEAELAFDELIETCDSLDLVDKMQAMRKFLGENNLMAYLTMMAIRLIEMKRVLKDTGSIYLHCDPTASHYLKLVMDAVFGADMYRNEIIWRNTAYNKAMKQFGSIHQTIFFYSKTDLYKFIQVFTPYSKQYIDSFFRFKDSKGVFRPVLLTGSGTRQGDSGKEWRDYNPTLSNRHWAIPNYLNKKYYQITGEDIADYPLLKRLDLLDEIGLIYKGKQGNSVPNYKYYLEDAKGKPLQDIWATQPSTKGCVYGDEKQCIDEDVKWLSSQDKERLGYPTQKPEALLERIIKASSNEGDVVLDPFCGCGTAVVAAEKLHRKWIGIDITYLAIKLIRKRLKDTFRKELSEFNIEGIPQDLKSAEHLATDSKKGRFQFEWWALDAVDADYAGDKKMGADKGIDGIKMFKDEPRKPHKKIVFQVKSGKVQFSYVQQLKGAMKDEGAVIGVLITLQKPTKPMIKEASKEGFYVSPLYPDRRFPRIQILTIEEIFDGKRPEYPVAVSFDLYKNAVRQQKADDSEKGLL
jgi:DNA modification methylase